MFNINFFYNYNNFIYYKLNNFIIFFLIYLFIFLIYYFVFLLIFNKKKIIKIKKIYFENFLFEIFLFFFFIILIFIILFLTTFIIIKKKKIENFIIIKLVSYQWKWYINYIYKSKNISYFCNIKENFFNILNYKKKNTNYLFKTDFNILLPIKKIIKIYFTSNDVIHSLFLPNLNFKKDFLNNNVKDSFIILKKKKILRGFCTELCGKNHSFMPLNIKFVNLLNFKKWIISKKFNIFFFLNY